MLICNFLHFNELNVRRSRLGQQSAGEWFTLLKAHHALVGARLSRIIAAIVVATLDAVAHTKLTNFRRLANFQLELVCLYNSLHFTRFVLLLMK